MESNSEEIESLKKEINELRIKLSRAEGFISFVESNDDPSHTLRSPLVSIQSFIGVLELLEYQINRSDLKEMTDDIKASSSHLLKVLDEVCKTL